MKSKKIVSDVFLNIVANALPTLIINLIILPFISRIFTGDEYGTILTCVAGINFVSVMFGTGLNNIRLLHNGENSEYEGMDFSLLLLGAITFNCILILFFLNVYNLGISFLDIILIIIVSIVTLLREYYRVVFRIRLDFTGIFVNNVFLTLGYIVGLFVCQYVRLWEAIYILGNAFSLAYIMKRSTIWKELLIKSPRFNFLFKEYARFLFATLLSNIPIHFDKIMLFSVFGGETVAVYNAANIFGKLVPFFTSPLSNVALSYLVKKEKDDRRLFFESIILSLFTGIIVFFICLMISPYLLTLLYPQFKDDAMNYVRIVTITGMIQAIASIITPFLLRYKKMSRQIVINGISSMIYICLAMITLKIGLKAFCFGGLIAGLIKIIIMIMAYII